MWNGGLERVETVIEGQECVLAEGYAEGLLLD
jgi:hypothetical protein